MSPPLNRTEHYEHSRLASDDHCTETRNYHLLMAKNFTTLAEVGGVEDSTRPANRD